MRIRKYRVVIGALLAGVLLAMIGVLHKCNTLSPEVIAAVRFSHVLENVSAYEQAGFEVEQKNSLVVLSNRAENPTIEMYLFDKDVDDATLKYNIRVSRNPLGNDISSWLVLYAVIAEDGQGSMKIWLDCSSPLDGHRQLEKLLVELFSVQ